MKIFVLVKRVPDTGIPLKLRNDKKGVEKEGVPHVINPYDEYAVEAALRIKEKIGGEVIVLSSGEENSNEVIRHALAMGGDRGILLKTNGEIDDSLQVGKIIGEYLLNEKPDLILMGKKSVDYDRGIVPAIISEILNIPFVSSAVNIEIKDSKFILERETEYGVEVIEGEAPLIITFEKAKFEPRFPSLRGVMMAKKKNIEIKEIDNLPEKTLEIISYEPPPERKKGRIIDLPFPENVKELIRLLKEEAKVI